MRRSPNRTDHALQPEEYLAAIEKAIRYIAAQKGINLPKTDSDEAQLELILRYVIRSGKALGVTGPAAYSHIPLDDKVSD